MILIFFLLYMYTRSHAAVSTMPDPPESSSSAERTTTVMMARPCNGSSTHNNNSINSRSCMLDHFFDDKRACAAVLMLWTLSVCGLLQTLDLLHSDFMTWGPSAHTRFMTVSIDTWDKWWLLSVATFANACVTEFMTDSIVPWLQNTVQDHKTAFLPYSKATCFVISQAWCFHCNVMALFSVALIMTQIDFLLVRMAADLLVSSFTTFKFMRNKTVDPTRYNMLHDRSGDRGSRSTSLDGNSIHESGTHHHNEEDDGGSEYATQTVSSSSYDGRGSRRKTRPVAAAADLSNEDVEILLRSIQLEEEDLLVIPP